MATAPGKSRITELDGIRAIAIGMVFLNHLFHVRLMWAGVDMFFILSGFLITGILIAAKHRTIGDYFRHFYARRARRILPPYLMLLLVTALFFGVSWLRWAYMYLFLMNAMQPGTSQPTNLNILWSLAIEEQFYMFWPLVVFFLSETAIAWTAGSIVILVPLLRFFCTPYVTFFHIYQWTIFRMDLMALGALFAVLSRRRRNLFVRWGVYGPLLTGGALFAMLVLSRRPGFSTGSNLRLPNLLIYEFTLLGGAGMVLWALGGRLTAPLRWAWVGYLGRISYSFYLIHTTVLLLLAPHIHGAWLLAALTLAITLMYCALSWQFLEKPILYAGAASDARRQALVDERAITS